MTKNSAVFNIVSPYVGTFKYFYQAIQLHISINGYYFIKSNSSRDIRGYLYNNTFNPNDLSTNLLSQNDNIGGTDQFRIEFTLQEMTRYILVVAAYNVTMDEEFSIMTGGPGSVVFIIP